MNLTETADIVHWPESHYVFVEKVGPFAQTAPQAWQEARATLKALAAKNQILGFTSLYDANKQVYRAGFTVAAMPLDLPEGLRYERFRGGRYCRFMLTGPYSELGEASGRVWDLVERNGIPVREDFAIENYVNNPHTTPEEELITEILIPTA